MAATGRHVGKYYHKNGRFLINNLEKLWPRRSFHQSPVLQRPPDVQSESTESFVIPRKKTWREEAVLEALASTVIRDPSAYAYQFQDDPYLSPRTSSEFTLYSLSLESGRSAAKFFINNNPKFFTRDLAEPHVPCLMPESVSLHLEEVSEEALKERISLRRVTAAVDMFDQLLQDGKAVSVETTHELLDLICLYGDRDPLEEAGPAPEEAREAGEDRRRKGRFRKTSTLKSSWSENNSAERIFSLLQEQDTRCYSALIRGMVQHGAFTKAFSLYTDMLNNRVTGDVHVFNALISAAPEVRDKYNERWELIAELLTQMNQHKVQPTLRTFNSVLKALRRCGHLAKTHALHTLSEMKAVGIAPSLASYDHILAAFFRSASSNPSNIDILQELMSEIKGTRFTCRDPDDVFFFCSAMRICLDHKDLECGYKVQSLVDVGENWRILGDPYQQSIYYGRFFNLLCMMEHVDVVLRWYRRLIPSLYYPNPQGLRDLLQALDADSRLDLLPTVFRDIRSLGHHNKLDLMEELLGLMSRDKHGPEVQDQFGQCALELMTVLDGDRGRPGLEWSSSALSNITALLLRAHHTQHAWKMLHLFKSKNRVPTVELVEQFLSVCTCSDRAVELVQISSSFCLSCTSRLTEKVLCEFNLNEHQRSVLSELESASEPSD